MSFPSVSGNAHGNNSGSSHSITIPAVSAGDIVVVVVGSNNNDSGGPTSISGFTELFDHSEGDGVVYGALHYKVIDGTEGWGSGGSATLVHTNTSLCAWVVLAITGANSIEATDANTSTPGDANPPNLAPSWALTDTLWLACAIGQNAPTITSPPSGYTTVATETAGNSFQGETVSVARKTASATSENPGTFTMDDVAWIAFTVGLSSPAPATPVESPPYEAPPPGAAVVEIYAAEAGAARWDEALWGEAVWSSAGWQDVTPESVDVDILWGSQRPELGILSSPDPASWAVEFHDPDRTLDPANAEGPYYGDLQPGLPVRVSHNGTVVKQGIAESIGYQFSREFGAQDVAYMRVTDIISTLGNARVPTDSTLADTLFARARDAVSASGLVVTVLADPPSGDPDLAPWVTGQDMSAWEWIMDAAQSVLWQPYVTNVGHLGFRPYATPLDRGRVIASPNLVGLQSIIEHNGLYSVVTAQDDTGTDTFVTRELTPKPRYGARQYIRENATPDAGDWALAVLRDRANAGLRWVPGEVYPLTASDVHDFATIEAIETVSIVDLEADPAIIAEVIVVGGRIHVQGKKDSEAVWDFTFEAAQTATPPLVTEDLSELLVRDDDPTEYLYPD